MSRRNSKELISIALYQLMYRIPYHDINVKLLCEKAHVSRMSFYRNYSSIEDVFVQYSDERFAEFYDLYLNGKEVTLESFTYGVVRYIKQYSRQIAILQKADKMSVLVTQFERYASFLKNHVKSIKGLNHKSNSLAIPYFAGGLYNVLVYWNKQNFRQSEEEIASQLLELISATIPLE